MLQAVIHHWFIIFAVERTKQYCIKSFSIFRVDCLLLVARMRHCTPLKPHELLRVRKKLRKPLEWLQWKNDSFEIKSQAPFSEQKVFTFLIGAYLYCSPNYCILLLLYCYSQHPMCVAGLLSDWYPNLDALKESCRIASSYNWADVDLSPFQGAVTNRCFGIYIHKLCGVVFVSEIKSQKLFNVRSWELCPGFW